jgi:excisionase family DNA binding protein
MTKPLLIKIGRVAVILDCSVSTVRRLIRQGELVSHNNHRGLKGTRITTESVEIYVEKYKISTDMMFE